MGLAITAPTSFWRLEEASGTRIDSAAGGNDLTPNGTPLPGNATGKIGNALSLVAANSQYVGRTSTANLSMGAGVDFSFSAWFYLTDLSVDQVILSKSAGGALADLEYLLVYSAANFVVGGVFTAIGGITNEIDTVAHAVTANTWQHVAWTVETGTSSRKMYFNGALVGSATNNTNACVAGTDNFNIGYNPNRSRFTTGIIDAVGFWRGHVLTATEVGLLYSGGLTNSGTEYYGGQWVPASLPGGPFQQNLDGNFTAGMTGGYAG